MARPNSDRTTITGAEKEEKSIGATVIQYLLQWLPPLSSFLLYSLLYSLLLSLLFSHNSLFFFK